MEKLRPMLPPRADPLALWIRIFSVTTLFPDSALLLDRFHE